MKDSKIINGKCLCGSVTVAIKNNESTFDVCHCGICRKWGGGPAFTIDGGKHFEITGKESITIFRSSEWAERGFCKLCGSHIFFRLTEADFYNFSLGLFKESDDFKFKTQIFIDSKPSNYDFANSTENLTEAEVLAKFT